MATHINYYTNEEAQNLMCPEVKTRTYKGTIQAYNLKRKCIGSACAEWYWHEELNNEGLKQGHCGKIIPDNKLK